MDIGLVGDGPAVEAVSAALGDVDVNVMPVEPSLLDGFDLAVVVDATGSATFDAANDLLDRWIAVEVGGLGGTPLADVDAAVTVLEDACYDCLRDRVASGDAEAADAPQGTRSAVRYAGAVAGRTAIRLLAGEPVGDTVREVPGPTRSLLPVPGCGCGSEPGTALTLGGERRSVSAALERAERGVDARIGLVSEVGERESFPVPYYVSHVADTTPFSDVRAAEFAAGADDDWDAAFMKALGEGLERYAAGVYRASSFTTATEADVPNPVAPDAFVRPDDAAGYSPGDELAWISGERLVTEGRPGSETVVSLPAEFVCFPPPERRYRPAITTGLGLGNTGAEAALSGLYETIERDATMTTWYSTTEPLGLELDDPVVDRLRKRARAESLSVSTLLVTTDVDVPVVAAAVHRDGEWPRFAAGSGADLDPVSAARNAIAEALQNWTELRSMGRETAAEQEAAIGRHADLPDATREFFDPDATVPATSLDAPDLESGTDGESGSRNGDGGVAELEAVVDRVRSVGLDPVVARTTTRDVAALGFEAVRVLVPGAQPLFTGDPFFGERAREVPRSMGFEPTLDRAYHPFP
ncbi:YcaO-like family protein [Halorubrum rubrum]|uniref:YcaO-like family protein n=1 Tax=Halorubrum rubrum TaxID=1126240 RepID=A0ABD5R3H4_9EURY|nr:YcaO-like family protein [Halorubrum rubrum]